MILWILYKLKYYSSSLIGNERNFAIYLNLPTGTPITLLIVTRGRLCKLQSPPAMNVTKVYVCAMFQKMFDIVKSSPKRCFRQGDLPFFPVPTVDICSVLVQKFYNSGILFASRYNQGRAALLVHALQQELSFRTSTDVVFDIFVITKCYHLAYNMI